MATPQGTQFRFRIKELISELHIVNPSKVFKQRGISNRVLSDFRNDKRKSMTLHQEEVFISVFRCNSEDLLEWTPKDKSEDYPENPLQRYRKRVTFDLMKEIGKLSYAEVRKMIGKE